MSCQPHVAALKHDFSVFSAPDDKVALRFDRKGTTLSGRLLTYDSMRMRFGELKLRRDKNCPACGDNPTIHDLSAHASPAAAVCAV